MTVSLGLALMIYIVVGVIWLGASGSEYNNTRCPRDARMFLMGFVWPIVVAIWCARLVMNAIVDAFRSR